MKKIISILIILMYLGCNQAFAENDDLISAGIGLAAGLFGGVLDAALGGESSNNKTSKRSAFALKRLGYAEVDDALFDIPLGASVDTVLSWCEKNNVDILNQTKKDINEHAREAMWQINKLKTRVTFEKWKNQVLGKSLEGLYAEMVSNEIVNYNEAVQMNELQKNMELLKNPHFQYQQKQRYFYSAYSAGINIKIDGEEHTCKDKRITDAIYYLRIKPSRQSELLLSHSVVAIEIFFLRLPEGGLVSQVAKAKFSNNSRQILKKEFDLISETLREKYGKSVVAESQANTGELRSDPSEWEIKQITNNDLSYSDLILWRKNIFMVAEYRNTMGGVVFDRDQFLLFYYKPDNVKRVAEICEKALDDYRKNLVKKESEHKYKAKSLF
ncbi:MAG: hypothetical protein KAI70_03400 [Candidatus Omnitrophica bacterium]|nr:hypothetical protein [Candidatus Omnitrophota bacterium]